MVYQAFSPAIGHHAIAHGRFGGPAYRFGRMSWIKPNFLWMMYRSGWGLKTGQEVVLGLRIRRSFFEEILCAAVSSRWERGTFASEEAYRCVATRSEVRLQWDPDHAPNGAPLPRRAIQLGLRGETLRRFATEELVEVIDLSAFVAEQRGKVGSPELLIPLETAYLPSWRAARAVGLDVHEVAS